jgi:SAM-dependent methyltransferase
MADAAEYGDLFADVYDEMYPADGQIEQIVAGIDRLAAGGPVLELGVGTGRIAVPAYAAGVDISGMDASHAMLDRLATKPDGARIPTFLGDFASTALGGPYSVVFVAFNTLFLLLDQRSQVACFRNVASSLDDGGRFVIEAFVPDLGRFDRGQRTSLTQLRTDSVQIDVALHDLARQRVSSAHVLASKDGIRILPVEIRYAWPSELDLMAQLASLELEHRWEWWDETPFTSTSPRHVSVYRRREPETKREAENQTPHVE